MPSLDVIVHANWLLINTPVLGCEDGALNPLALDVVDQGAEGFTMCLKAEPIEHGRDLMMWKEWQGHQLSNVSIDSLVIGVRYL